MKEWLGEWPTEWENERIHGGIIEWMREWLNEFISSYWKSMNNRWFYTIIRKYQTWFAQRADGWYPLSGRVWLVVNPFMTWRRPEKGDGISYSTYIGTGVLRATLPSTQGFSAIHTGTLRNSHPTHILFFLYKKLFIRNLYPSQKKKFLKNKKLFRLHSNI